MKDWDKFVESISDEDANGLFEALSSRRSGYRLYELSEIEKTLVQGRKRVLAIKAVRNRLRCSLLSARESVNRYQDLWERDLSISPG